MFHVVYSRHMWDREDGYGTFENAWTVLRNVSYDRLDEFTKEKLAEKKAECDAYYKMYIENTYAPYERPDESQLFSTECYIIDDADYFKTYKDVYPDTYIPFGGKDEKEDYFHDYGQTSSFMLQQDYGRA